MDKKLNDKAFVEGLHNHLKKCEIEFIAKHKEHGGYIPDVELGIVMPEAETETYLKSLGFRIKERYDCEGENWIRYYGGLNANLTTGFIIHD